MWQTSDVLRLTHLITLAFSLISSVTCDIDEATSSRIIAQANTIVHKFIGSNLLMYHSNDNEIDVWFPNNNDTACYHQIKLLRSANKSHQTWADKMLDASSKNTSRSYSINIIDNLQLYEKCMSIKTQINNDNMKVHYCSYNLNIEWNEYFLATVDITICFPILCNTKHIHNALDELKVNLIGLDSNFSIKYNRLFCSNNGFEPWTYGGIIAVAILGIFTCFLVISTICDFYMRTYGEMQGVPLKLLSEFSFYTNSLRTLSTKPPPDNLSVISGLRFLSMCWVILQHTCNGYFMDIPLINQTDYLQWLYSWKSLYYLSSGFSVDTFFAISGCLASYIFLKKMSKGHTFNPLRYYMHRYLRLTPAVGAMLLLTIFIFPRLGSGPLWTEKINIHRDQCMKTWWYMLLYIHNYVEPKYLLGLVHLWYLAVDMQLFWISPIILYPLAKKPTVGLIILSLFTIASIIIPAVISAKYKYSNALLLSFNQDPFQVARNFFGPTYTRAGPWLIGIFVGYMLACKKGHGRIVFMKLAWVLIVLSLGFIFFSYKYYQSKNDYKYGDYYFYWEVFYSGFSHHIWAVGVCCIIYVSVYGYGGILNEFLSHPFFFPLSKISYSVYVVHAMILDMVYASERSGHYFTMIDLTSKFFSMLIWSLISGFIFNVLFETPFIVAEKIILGDVAVVSVDKTNSIGNLQYQNATLNVKFDTDESITNETQL